LPYPALDRPQAIALLDHAGIDKPCIFARPWIAWEFMDPEFEAANNAIYKTTQEYPHRVFGQGRVHSKYGKAAAGELLRRIEEYRLGGLKLHPDTKGHKEAAYLEEGLGSRGSH
jgi:predicted TIM-barrel fold metal-dependent hydrolase